MKRKKTLLILGGVLVVAVAAIGVEKAVTRHVESIQTVDEEVFAADADSLTKVSWTEDGTTLTFEQTDGTWHSSDDETFPVDQDTMKDFLDNYASVHASFIIDDVDDYGQYGLEKPQCTVTFTDADGNETTISMGDYSTMDSKRYIETGDGNVYLIDDDLMETIRTDRDDFLKNDEIPVYDTTETILVDGENPLDVVIDAEADTYTYSTNYQYYLDKDGTYLPLADSNIQTYMGKLEDLISGDYATYNASSEDLADYGLDDPALTITVTGSMEEDTDSKSSDDTETAEAEDIPATYTLYFGENGDKVYLRMDDSEIIYNVDSDTYTDIAATDYNTLRPSEVLAVDWSTVNSLQAVIGSTEYEFTFDNSGKEQTCTYEDQDVDMADIEDAADAMAIDSFLDEDPTLDEEMYIILNLDNDLFPQVRVDIYQYNGDDCLVQVDGETVGLMSRSQMVDLREALTSAALGKSDDTETEQ